MDVTPANFNYYKVPRFACLHRAKNIHGFLHTVPVEYLWLWRAFFSLSLCVTGQIQVENQQNRKLLKKLRHIKLNRTLQKAKVLLVSMVSLLKSANISNSLQKFILMTIQFFFHFSSIDCLATNFSEKISTLNGSMFNELKLY